MTAIDKLRELLDERGVEWTEVDKHTLWWGESTHHQASAYSSILFGESERVHLSAMVTPEQAIDATLGSFENELLRDKIADYDKMYTHICEQLASVKRSLAAARAENAKLRELVRDMWHDGMCECDERGACAECEYHFPDRMRELGIEVGE